MPQRTLLLLADDLTGAADCAAYAPALGVPAAIYPQAPPLVRTHGLQAFATNSRALGPDAAHSAVMDAFTGRHDVAAKDCFKKIDSLLRGNVGAEVEAMLEALAAPAALICPALPAQGRSVVDGRLAHAPNGARIATVLAAQSTLPQAHIGIDAVRGAGRALLQAVMAITVAARLVIADAQTDRDLDALVAAWRAAAPTGLLCGSAGLAAAWLRAHAPPGAAPLDTLTPTPPVDLVVVGSASAMAHAQIAAVAARPGTHVVEVGRGALPVDAPGARLLLHLPRPATPPAHDECAAGAHSLADAAFAHMQRAPVQHLLVAGGDTAQALCARLGIARLDVLRAALPGMPTCAAQRVRAAPLWVTLKAGNHGSVDTLALLMQQ